MAARRGAVRKGPRNIHDSYFRAVLEDPKRAADFLRCHLPPAIVPLLADEPPELLDTSFVTEVLRNRQSDRLFRVKLKSGEYIFVNVEHASSVVPDMMNRLQRYRQLIWDREEATRSAKPGRIAPILAIVVYHGRARWTAPHSPGDVITADPELQDRMTEDPELRGQMYGPGYRLRDIGRMPEDEWACDPDLKGSLLAFVHAYRGQAGSRVLSRIRDLVSKGTKFEEQTYQYILNTFDIDLETLLATVEAKGATTMASLAEQLISKGRAEGEARGRAEGEARGEARGEAKARASTLNRLLERRFGRVPAAVRERVRSASVHELDAWLDALLDAPTLEAVFEHAPRH